MQSKIVEQQYNYNPCKIYIQQQGDSLFIKQMNAFRTDAVLATIVAFTNGEDTIAKQIICLPASVAINPFATYYQIKTANANEQYSLLQKNGMINCVALRTKDSIAIQVNNPNKLFFRYTLFAGNEVIKKGYSDKLILHEKTKTSKNYFISLQYIYGNKSYSENYAAAYQDKLLTVQAEQPPFVYPGQTANITVNVTNAIGKPVQDADVTAYAVTKKFTENMVPYVPYLGKRYPDGKVDLPIQ